MDATAYLFENLQKMHESENKTKSLKENKSIKRKMVKESYDFKNALDDNMGITTLDELQDTYENVTDELEKALNLKSNQIVSLTEEDLDAVIDDVDEETLDEITNLFSKVNSANTIKTINDEDMGLNIEIKNVDNKLFGYENLDGLSAIWFDINYLDEEPFKNNNLKENRSLKESENKDLDSTISRIKARTTTNESCNCEDKDRKEELDEGCNKKKTLKEDIQLYDSIAGFIDYYQLGADDVVTAYDNYYSIDEIHEFEKYLGQEYELDLEEYLDESFNIKKLIEKQDSGYYLTTMEDYLSDKELISEDLETLLNCNNEKDLVNATFKYYNCNKLVLNNMNNLNYSFDEAKQSVIDFLKRNINESEKQAQLRKNWTDITTKILPNIKKALNQKYNFLGTDNSCLLYSSDETLTKQNVKEFIDIITTAVNGKSFKTGIADLLGFSQNWRIEIDTDETYHILVHITDDNIFRVCFPKSTEKLKLSESIYKFNKLKESLETIDEMTFEYMKDAIDAIQRYFNKNGVLTDELKELVNNAYITLDKAYEIADLDLMNESCKAKKEYNEPKNSKKKELEECLARIDGATLNKLVTEFVKNNYKNIDKIIFSKAMLEGNALTFKGKMKFTTGKVENIELKADNFSKKLFAKESFNLGVTDKLNTFHIVKESKNIPFVITCKNVNGKVMFESLHYNYLVENVKEPVKGRIKL